MELRPDTVSETSQFAGDLDAMLERHRWLRAKYLMADKGHDRLKNFKHAVKRGIIPVIAVRRPQMGSPWPCLRSLQVGC